MEDKLIFFVGNEGARHLFLVSGTLNCVARVFLDLFTFLCCTD